MVIKEGSTIPVGCVIGDQVVIGPNATLLEFDRLSAAKKIHQYESDTDGDEDNSDVEEVEASE